MICLPHSALAVPVATTGTMPATMRPVTIGPWPMTAMHAMTGMGSMNRRPMTVMRPVNIARPVTVRVIHAAIGLIDIGIAIAVPRAYGVAARQKQYERGDSQKFLHDQSL